MPSFWTIALFWPRKLLKATRSSSSCSSRFALLPLFFFVVSMLNFLFFCIQVFPLDSLSVIDLSDLENGGVRNLEALSTGLSPTVNSFSFFLFFFLSSFSLLLLVVFLPFCV
jgi:hypothetical protein